MTLPKQLHRDDFGFAKLRKKSKKPYEEEWQKNPHSWEEITEHIRLGNNYGVMGGYGNLIIVDSDSPELEEVLKAELSETFTVKTSKGRHRYFICEDIDDIGILRLNMRRLTPDGEGEKIHVGEVIAYGGQCVGPGSIHPDTGNQYEVEEDVEIAEITKEQIYSALLPFMTIEYPHGVSVKDCCGVSITDVATEYGIALKRSGDRLSGPHPIHGSSNGENFCVSPAKNAWHCFRCESGGGPLQLIALMEEILDCSECKKGTLRGDKFKQTALIAEERFDVKILENQTEDQRDRVIDRSEVDEMMNRLTTIPPDTDRKILQRALEPILTALAKVSEPQALEILKDALKGHFDFTQKDAEPYLKVLREKHKKLSKREDGAGQPILNQDEILQRLKHYQNDRLIHPAQDFSKGIFYFGFLLDKQLILITSERQLIQYRKESE